MAEETVKIVTFGDSITVGVGVEEPFRWVNLMKESLRESFPGKTIEVINAGVGGNTSREGLARIDADVLAHQPDIVTIEFGGNDATPEADRHVSLEEFRKNLETIKDKLENAGNVRIIMMTFPPVIEEQHCWHGNPFYEELGGQDLYIEEYRKISRHFAKIHNLLLADIDLALRQNYEGENVNDYILTDGVHLTEAGNKVVLECVESIVKKCL